MKKEMENKFSDKETTKIRRRLSVHLSFCIIGLVMISLVTATYAWFTLSAMSTVDGMEMTISTGTQLKVDVEDHGSDLSLYKANITNEAVNSQIAADNMKLEDMRLYPLTSSNGVNMLTQSGREVEKNKDNTFLEFKLYFLATENMWVHLTSENSTNGENEDGTLVSTNSTGLQSDVVKCTRISFTADGKTVIYEPNKGTAVAGQTTIDLPAADSMKYTNETRLFNLTADKSKEVTVRVWIEGEDPECDNDVQLSDLLVRLCFKGTDENNIIYE